jgi:hypothetical protein
MRRLALSAAGIGIAVVLIGGGAAYFFNHKGTQASPKAPEPVTEITLSEQDQGNIPQLLKDWVEAKTKLNDADLKLMIAINQVKAQKKLGDEWQPASDGEGGIKFIKAPPQPASNGSPQGGPQPASGQSPQGGPTQPAPGQPSQSQPQPSPSPAKGNS